MKEIKYISHLIRNLYLFAIFYISINLIRGTQLTRPVLLVSFLTYLISYAPIYFLNDFADHNEDKKHHRENLYLSYKNKKIFWYSFIFLTVVGLFLAFRLNSLGLLLALYLLNAVYTLKPTRTRDKYILREFTIFIIYALKVLYVSSLLQLPLSILPLPIIFMAASAAAAAVSVYKRYLKASKVSELIFGFVFVVSWLLTIATYRQVFWIFFPLAPAIVFLALKYKNEQVPIGIYQLGYFVYALITYLIIKI